ncbi:hypothetical protein [Streptomyces sp. NPDC058989]|uniref:hypothetical protein n=1 Tax=Streptomyces sp. NPDC058989 TaxID=3346686 RepID=UPI00368F7CC3
METDGTTPSEGGNGMRRARNQRRRDLWCRRWAQRQQRPRRPWGPLHRPLWQEPVRGALYAAGGSAITLLTPWVQHWIQHWMR